MQLKYIATQLKPMTSREICRDPIKYATMHLSPIIYKNGHDLIIIGSDIIQTNRTTENWSRYDYDYIATNHN